MAENEDNKLATKVQGLVNNLLEDAEGKDCREMFK